MTNEDSLFSNDDNLVYLRKKLNKETIPSSFRSKLVGGLNEDDVIKYIRIIEDKYHQIEQEMKVEMNELSSSRNKLQRELETIKTTAMEEKKSLLESLDKVQNNLASYIEKCKNLEQTLQSSSNKDTQLQNKINQILEERNELEELLSIARKENVHITETSAKIEIENTNLKKKVDNLQKENSSISNEMKDHLANLEIENTNLKAKINTLEKEISIMINQKEEIKKVCLDLEKQIEIEKSQNEKHTTDLNLYVISLEETIAENTIQLEEQRKILEKTENELKGEKTRISKYNISEFKDDIFNIYEHLKILSEEQDKINYELKKQLEVEQSRANKAENSLAELTKWVSNLKDKLYNEHYSFDLQFKEITEKYFKFQSELNVYFINLQELGNLSKEEK